MRLSNRRIVLSARPVGEPKAHDFSLEDQDAGPLDDGQIAVQVRYISLDPAMRGWMDDRPSYLPPVRLGDVMRATGVGRVIASRSNAIEVGDHVVGYFGVQSIAIVAARDVRTIDIDLAPLHVHAGLLATPGLTAYFGMLDVGRPAAGETVLVSGAAGAVGSIAGQIARLIGCTTIGVAGGAQKCAYLKEECGFTHAIDYKAENWKAAFSSACASGVDVYFDNVGNPILDAALARINQGARIVLCGAVSQYNSTAPVDGPRNYLALVVKRASMRGFIVFDYLDRYPEATKWLTDAWRRGDIHYQADIVQGVENFHTAFLRLFKGQNHGKALIEVQV